MCCGSISKCGWQYISMDQMVSLMSGTKTKERGGFYYLCLNLDKYFILIIDFALSKLGTDDNFSKIVGFTFV